MGRYVQLGKWIQRRRVALGLRSAAQLSKRASLSYNYVSILERGDLRPKTETLNRIAAALELNDGERLELFRLAKLGVESAAVKASVEGMALAGAVAWTYVPSFLSTVTHRVPEPWVWPPDQTLVDSVRAASSLLAWIALVRGQPTPAQQRRVEQIVRRAFDSMAGTTTDPTAFDAKVILPSAWRNIIFSSDRATVALTGLLQEWDYEVQRSFAPRIVNLAGGGVGVDDSPRTLAHLTFVFRDVALQRCYGVARRSPERIVAAHDALIAERLWNRLGLASTIGEAGTSPATHGWYHHVAVDRVDLLWHSDPAALRAALHRDDPPGLLYQIRAVVDDCLFALRLYDEPALGEDVLRVPRDVAITRLDAVRAILSEFELGGA